MPNLIKTTNDEGVFTITLTNPPANAYSYEMFTQMDKAILEARMDDNVHAIVLTGSGEKFFCAGADIAMLGSVTPKYKYYFCLHANETLLRLEHTPKIVIAAINGHCVGGGLEVALAADIRVAKKSTLKMGLPEVKLGVLPGTGGTQRLARLLGASKAFELMAIGDNLTLETAMELGLVSKAFEADNFDESIATFAKSFCPPNKASMAVGHIKRAVQTGAHLPLESGLALERELQQKLFQSQDAKEGMAAFKEKRKPSFKGA